MIVSLLAAAFIPYLYRKTPPNQRLMLYALPFVLGGAVGNLIDRLVFRYVIDFVQWYVTVSGTPRYWPTFNIADAAIVIGIGLMLLQMLPRRSRSKERDEEICLTPLGGARFASQYGLFEFQAAGDGATASLKIGNAITFERIETGK